MGGKAIFPDLRAGREHLPARLARHHARQLQDPPARRAAPCRRRRRQVELAGDEAAKLKASMLSGAQIAALSTMKQHTDFNDLAHKSELGIEGVKRQIGAAISQVQRDEQQHQEQKHVEKKATADRAAPTAGRSHRISRKSG